MIDTLKVTKKFLFKEFHRIAKERGVRLNVKLFSANSIMAGGFDESKNKIIINSECSKNKLPFIFFHELGHLHCVNNKIWDSYHNYNNTWKNFKLTALKAEKWIDSWAEKEVNKYFKNVNSYKIYHTEYGKEKLIEMVDTIDYNYWMIKNKKKRPAKAK